MPPKPAWAARIGDRVFNEMQAEMRDRPHIGYVLDHLIWCIDHPQQVFDVTFYQYQPILAVALNKQFARDLWAAFAYDQGVQRMKQLLCRLAFSDGTTVDASEVWTINFMPPNLDTTNIDLAQGAEIVGFGGETLREMIRNTYHCCSRAEEDFFLARWIAS